MSQLVKQIHVSKSDHYQTCRWDNVTKTLMFQNRSKDISLSLNDFLNRLTTTINQAKAKRMKISVMDVPINSKWPTRVN